LYAGQKDCQGDAREKEKKRGANGGELGRLALGDTYGAIRMALAIGVVMRGDNREEKQAEDKRRETGRTPRGLIPVNSSAAS
jgi:hypothetical protein